MFFTSSTSEPTPFLTIMCVCGEKRKRLPPYPTHFLVESRIQPVHCPSLSHKRQSCAQLFTDCNLPKSERHVALLSLQSRILATTNRFQCRKSVAKSALLANMSWILVQRSVLDTDKRPDSHSAALSGAATSLSRRVTRQVTRRFSWWGVVQGAQF